MGGRDTSMTLGPSYGGSEGRPLVRVDDTRSSGRPDNVGQEDQKKQVLVASPPQPVRCAGVRRGRQPLSSGVGHGHPERGVGRIGAPADSWMSPHPTETPLKRSRVPGASVASYACPGGVRRLQIRPASEPRYECSDGRSTDSGITIARHPAFQTGLRAHAPSSGVKALDMEGKLDRHGGETALG